MAAPLRACRAAYTPFAQQNSHLSLRVIGTAARPVITGRTNITDGELFFLNNRYRIERAVFEFANPVRTEPVVNLLATTKVNNFEA